MRLVRCVWMMPSRNSETQMMSATIRWMKQNTPDVKFLYTWADGIIKGTGYVYQAANFLYGGFYGVMYMSLMKARRYTSELFKKMKKEMNRTDTKYGSSSNDTKMGELGFSRVWGKQFRYIYPLNKKSRNF